MQIISNFLLDKYKSIKTIIHYILMNLTILPFTIQMALIQTLYPFNIHLQA